jgi:xylulokinase
MPAVVGVDSSTQSCKVEVRDAESGSLLRRGSAPHPAGSEVDPSHWWAALQSALESAGGLGDVAAMSVSAQQHGLVCLDEGGQVIRPALLWNDLRSAQAAEDLIVDLGGGDRHRGGPAWAERTGSVPVASFTVTKLRWLAEHEPVSAERVAAICLPHDWLSWRLSGSSDIRDLTTDRSDASGTGYWNPTSGDYDRELLALALGVNPERAASIVLPAVLRPTERIGDGYSGEGRVLIGPGCGDNAGAALGLGLGPGEVSVSLGTSGVVAAVSPSATRDASGSVAGFADAAGEFLPLACTLNGARVLDDMADLLGVDHASLSELALSAAPGAGGVVLVPYLEGERTPNLPFATGGLLGLTRENLTPANLARAAVEGLLCLMADAIEAIRSLDVTIDRVTLIGGGGRSPAVRVAASAVLGVPVVLPPPAEYVALGAARQAAWVLSGGEKPPTWNRGGSEISEVSATPWVLDRYRQSTALGHLKRP